MTGPPEPPDPAPGAGAPPSAARRRRMRWVLLGVGGVVVLVVLGVVAVMAVSGADEAAVRRTVTAFADAVDRHDQPALLAALCTEEASALTDDADYDPDEPPLAASPGTATASVRSVTLRGDVAEAVVDRQGGSATLYLTQEGGAWKVCASAGDRFTAAPH